MPDLIATIGAIALLPVAITYGTVRGGRAGGLAFLLALGPHLVLAALSTAGIFLPPVLDTLTFHYDAIAFLDVNRQSPVSGPSSRMWSYALSQLYTPFGPSLWLGYVANLWIYFAAMSQLARFVDETGAGKYRWQVVALFSLLPSSLLFANFLLRESFQILMLIITIRYLERYRRTGSLTAIAIASAAFVPFGAVHNGFFLFGPIAGAWAVLARGLLPPAGTRVSTPAPRIFGMAVGVALVLASVILVASYNESSRVAQLLEGDIDVAESIIVAGEYGARTAFPWAIGSGLADVVVNAPLLLVQFVLAPIFPLLIYSLEDSVAAADTLARGGLILLTVRAYRHAGTDERRMIVFLVVIYLMFCVVAALGTTTVGTAMRHHLKVFWITVALGVPALVKLRQGTPPIANYPRSRRQQSRPYGEPRSRPRIADDTSRGSARPHGA